MKQDPFFNTVGLVDDSGIGPRAQWFHIDCRICGGMRILGNR